MTRVKKLLDADLGNAADPWRPIILAYAPSTRRAAFGALLALDDRLANVVRTTSEPALGQIRLVWWHDALERLDSAPPPAEPVLAGLAQHVLPAGVRGAALAELIAGWDVLIEEEVLDDVALERFAAGRGQLFRLAGVVLGAGAGDPLAVAGKGWALADLAQHLGAPDEAARAAALARPLLAVATGRRWTRNARALGALAHLARLGLAADAGAGGGSPGQVGRLLWHRLTGR